jgi:hypothetical protein
MMFDALAQLLAGGLWELPRTELRAGIWRNICGTPTRLSKKRRNKPEGMLS